MHTRDERTKESFRAKHVIQTETANEGVHTHIVRCRRAVTLVHLNEPVDQHRVKRNRKERKVVELGSITDHDMHDPLVKSHKQFPKVL